MSNDSTSIEMAVGASMITRNILSQELADQKEIADLNEDEVREIASKLLHNNAVEIYKTGALYQAE